MPINLYDPCPCGSGKKVKFCCADLVDDMEKLDKSLQGQQYKSAMQQLERLEAKHPNHQWVLSEKAFLQFGLKDFTGASESVERILRDHPQHPRALSLKAIFVAINDGPEDAVPVLQQVMSLDPKRYPPEIANSMMMLASVLQRDGYTASAVQHLLVAGAYARDDKRISRLLGSILQDPETPAPLRDFEPWKPATPGSPLAPLVDKAIESARRGAFQRAFDQLETLSSEHPDDLPCLYNKGYLQAVLARQTDAANTLREYSIKIAGSSFDEAVEAEALAQIFDDPDDRDRVEFEVWEHPVLDEDRLVECLAAAPWAAPEPIAREEWTAAGEVPPQATYRILDRPKPPLGNTWTPADVPMTHGTVELFGTTTSRPAYLKYALSKLPAYEAAREKFLSSVGKFVGPGELTLSTSGHPRSAVELAVAPWLPERSSKVMLQLVRPLREKFFDEIWPSIPQVRFDGKTPAEAALDPALQMRVQAKLLLFELSGEEFATRDFDAWRARLGLPSLPPVTVLEELGQMPVLRLCRLEVDKLSDDNLHVLTHLAEHLGVRKLLRRAVQVTLERTPDASHCGHTAASMYAALVQTAPDTESALADLARARAACRTRQENATWDLLEVPIRLINEEPDEFLTVVMRLMRDYRDMLDIQRTLMQILTDYGLLTPDGQLRVPAPKAAAETAPAAGGLITGSAPAAAPTSGLWTPDQPNPSAKPKSGLWVPGS